MGEEFRVQGSAGFRIQGLGLGGQEFTCSRKDLPF